MLIEQLTYDDFAPCVRQSFMVRLDDQVMVPLELAEISQPASAGDSRRSFSLLFLGPVSRQYLLQHTYRLEHEQMGALEMFLVPLGPEGGRMRYEAVFN